MNYLFKYSAAVLVLLLIPVFSLFSQSGYTVGKTLFLPPEFYIGDQVEMRITLIPANTDLDLTVPEKLPDLSWIRFDSIEIFPGNDNIEIYLKFVSFHPGTRTLPIIELGNITLTNIKIHTESIIQDFSPEFQELRGQIFLPGTTLFIAFFIGFLLFIPIPLFFLFRKLMQVIKKILISRKRKKSYKKIINTLKDLRGGAGRYSSKRFYIIILNALRLYLSDRTGRDFLTPTTNELAELLTHFMPEIISDLNLLLQFGDYVKFGGREASIARKEQDLKNVERVTAIVEKKYLTSENSVNIKGDRP